jgi:Domain of unknown function (DUF5666)
MQYQLKHSLLTICALAALTLASGCGGGGSNTAGGPGVGGTGYANGPVTGFGSIIVNGVRFDDSSTSVSIADDDGIKMNRSDVKLGMLVDVVSGPITDDSSTGLKKAVATQISYGSSIKGVVNAIGTNTITVLGQTVNVPSTTVFDGYTSGFGGISVNDLVEVHALLNPANGQFEATRIERETSLNECKLTGIVNALNSGTTRFNISGFGFIDYSRISPTPSLADGTRVKVRLGFSAGNCTNSATRIDTISTSLTNNSSAEIEGYVTDFVNASNFKVNGIAVSTSAAIPGVANGSRVEAEGVVQNGVLVASKVEIKTPSASEVKLFGTPSSVDTLSKRLTINNVEVSYSLDDLKDGLQENALSSTRLEVRGRLDNTGTLVESTEIKPKSS